jgi:electron transfer flavoprotein alpha subunit
MARQLQVGLTGKTIEPRLYLALGISGAPYHLVGIKRAGIVVAINEDRDASIFERSDIGLVGDWATLMPAIAQLFQQRQTA